MLVLYVPVNNFSVMAGHFSVFLGKTITKQGLKYLSQRHKVVPTTSPEVEMY